MAKAFPRLLLAVSAILLAFGGIMHARAFGGTVAAVAASNLPTFYAKSLKALWLIDSATLLTLSVIFGLIASRPYMARRPVILLLAVVPGATAYFLYRFLGNFLPAHMLVAAAVTAALGGFGIGSIAMEPPQTEPTGHQRKDA